MIMNNCKLSACKGGWKEGRGKWKVEVGGASRGKYDFKYSSSPHSSHIWFSYIHNFIIILSQVYNEPIQRTAPSWLVSSIGRALHRCRRGHGFESHTSLNYFQAFFSQQQKVASLTAMIMKIQNSLDVHCNYLHCNTRYSLTSYFLNMEMYLEFSRSHCLEWDWMKTQ